MMKSKLLRCLCILGLALSTAVMGCPRVEDEDTGFGTDSSSNSGGATDIDDSDSHSDTGSPLPTDSLPAPEPTAPPDTETSTLTAPTDEPSTGTIDTGSAPETTAPTGTETSGGTENTDQPIDTTALALDELANPQGTFTHVGGCGDIMLYACNADQTLGLFFRRDPGLVERACEQGIYGGVDLFSPGDGRIELTLRRGENLCVNACNDVLDLDAEVVTAEYTAVSGAGQIDVAPRTPGCGAPTHKVSDANLWLYDVAFAAPDGAHGLHLGELSLTGVPVGWLPG